MRAPTHADGPPKTTVTLACRHRITRYLADHPQALRGCSLRCPICNDLRTVWLANSSSTACRPAGDEQTAVGTGQRILIFGGEDG